MKQMPGIHKPSPMRRVNRYAPLLAVLLLAMMGLGNLSRPDAADAEPYHARVREAAEAIPHQIGDWIGRDVEPPREAVELLRPNVLVSRIYEHAVTGRSVTLLLVHCKDARDMAGHYPPNCYPAHGWVVQDSRPRDWQVGGVTIRGTEYRLSYRRATGTDRMIVDNFMIMPDGSFLREMEGVYNAAADYRAHFFGAGQMQLVMDATIPASERDAIFNELVGANMAVIDALRSGVETAGDSAP